MSEVVDRIARAMWEVRRKHAAFAKMELMSWEDENNNLRDDVRAEARAVLESIKVPTDAMLAAGMAHEGTDLRSEYTAMIEEALK